MRQSLFKFFALFGAMLLAFYVHAQTAITGKVVDEVTRLPLAGVTVTVVGTNISIATDDEGDFALTATQPISSISLKLVGYEVKDVTVPSGTTVLGTIELTSSSTSLSEIMVTANSVAIDRKTPVAVSTVRAQQIEEKLGSQEFPEIMKTTPGIFITRQGGGYGDSRVNLRGFNSANVAVMINGVPVNDMENGWVYWSNWAGLSDVTSMMQVQRGLGASKVAVPSTGGTMNIITKTTDAVQGGSVYFGIGNNGYNKMAFNYSTGLTEDGWALSVLGSRTTGDGWAEGLQFEGYSYFFSLAKRINDNHTLSLTGFGAPQVHGQRQNRQLISTFKNAPQGLRYNSDWGVKDGQIVNVEDNFYHKPQFSLNHNWSINNKSFLSTALYLSTGSGGGSGISGVGLTDLNYRTGDQYSPYDLDAMVARNLQNSDGSASIYRYASRNDHNWYGILSTYQNKLSSNFDLLAGVDLRSYKGIHFREITDLLGADYYLDRSDVNNPAKRTRVGDKFSYYNDGIVLWEGGFLQGEYSTGPLSAFASVSLSNTSYKRVDYFLYEESDPLRESDYYHFFGYQVKGGANYNFGNSNVFANLGHFNKAPNFDAVFPIFNNHDVNAEAEMEKITSFELGYGYTTSRFNARLNLYHTTWSDRTFQVDGTDTDGQVYFANLLGVDARHMGVELELFYRPIDWMTFRGQYSFGDWIWTNNLDSLTVYNEAQEPVIEVGEVFMEGMKVGDQAQTSAAASLDIELWKGVKIGGVYTFNGNYFAFFDPTTLGREDLKPWKAPNYSLFDLNAVFNFKVGNLDAALFANVNNVFNTEYVSDANAVFDSETGVSNAANSFVYFGTGRTYSTGLKVKF